MRRILLGSVLRRLREAAGLSMREAGYPIRATASKISRLETGKVSFKQRDIADLLTLYGVIDDTERGRVLDLVHEANSPGWWHGFGGALPPWFEAFVGLESAAAVVRTYEVQFIPGLLQCPDYIRAVVSANHAMTTGELERRIELRTRRQAVLQRNGGPLLWVVLDEAALRRPIGGPGVMRTQIRHLIEHAAHPHVTIQLLPYAAGAHAAEGGAFTLLHFDDADLPDLVYLEHLTGARYIEKAEDVEHYARAMDRVSADALHPGTTIAALEYLIR